MTGLPSPQTRIDSVAPINWASARSQLLHGAWFCLPGMMSGSTVPNLTREYGSSMNLVSAAGFQGIAPPGGAGSIRFNSNYGRAPFTHPSSAEWTIAGWVRISSVSSNGYVAILGASGTNTIGITSNSSAGKFSAVWNAAVRIAGAFTWTAGTWYHLALAANASGGNIYVNGTSYGSDGTAVTAFTPAQFDLAAQTNISSPQVTGNFADWMVINRRLTSFQVEQLYFEAIRGYPTLLRRIKHSWIAEAAATGNRRRRVIMGSAA